MKSPAFQSASQLLRALRHGTTTSRDLLEQCLERVSRLNPALNAVVTLDVERARAAADAADRARAAGTSLGPLHGLPITVKDTYETAGVRTTCGVPELADHVSTVDAVSVGRLRAAGAVIFGKTNTPTWAGDWQTTNPVFGTTHNPWDRTKTPGGSSGGSAVAIAAGLSSLELGSDIGGSIRVPAHCCGVFGHKPSHGLVTHSGAAGNALRVRPQLHRAHCALGRRPGARARGAGRAAPRERPRRIVPAAAPACPQARWLSGRGVARRPRCAGRHRDAGSARSGGRGSGARRRKGRPQRQAGSGPRRGRRDLRHSTVADHESDLPRRHRASDDRGRGSGARGHSRPDPGVGTGLLRAPPRLASRARTSRGDARALGGVLSTCCSAR
jgi:hypothetical protein